MSPHVHHSVYSLPPEGGARRPWGGPAGDAIMSPHVPHFVYSLPPKGARVALGAAPRETHP
jgi:hypothetical protein